MYIKTNCDYIVCYFQVLTREMGYKNLILAGLSSFLIILILIIYTIFYKDEDASHTYGRSSP